MVETSPFSNAISTPSTGITQTYSSLFLESLDWDKATWSRAARPSATECFLLRESRESLGHGSI